MKTTLAKGTRGQAARRTPALKLRPVAAGCMVLLLGGAELALAQQTETVVVTGIRKGIEDAINVKRNADTIVEALSAEDIGKLPDASVAESISRLPGVATQRSSVTGKAQDISVRGLSPDFNGGVLNGREQASTSTSRALQFDQFPADTTLVLGVARSQRRSGEHQAADHDGGELDLVRVAHAAVEALVVEQLEQGGEALGVAVVRGGREEELVLEVLGEGAEGEGAVGVLGEVAASGGSDVVGLVDDQKVELARKDRLAGRREEVAEEAEGALALEVVDRGD
jgi:hypothetical protein